MKPAKASHVYSQLTPWERSEILRLYDERLSMTAIARQVGQSLRVVRTFISLEIQAKRIKEQIDLVSLEREITKAKRDYDKRMHTRLENGDSSGGIPRGSDRHIYDRRAAIAGSRKLLEAVNRYLEKREAEKGQGND